MKATELIEKLYNAVNNHGDFDIKVALYDDETSARYECSTDDGWGIDFYFDQRDNQMGGGWICVDNSTEDDEED